MTNLEKMKEILCNTINAMSPETLFDFISEYDEEDSYFSNKHLLTCRKCHALYGDCDGFLSEEADEEQCKSRFLDYCSKQSTI